jgi:transcriptional regulator with XRE-family HTH domain
MIKISAKALADRLAMTKPPSMTHGEWADALGTSRQTWSSYINGSARPSTAVLMKIKEIAGYNVDWILFGNSPSQGLVERSKLLLAVSAAMSIVDTAVKAGKAHSSDQVCSFIADIYESMLREAALQGELFRVAKQRPLEIAVADERGETD